MATLKGGGGGHAGSEAQLSWQQLYNCNLDQSHSDLKPLKHVFFLHMYNEIFKLQHNYDQNYYLIQFSSFYIAQYHKCASAGFTTCTHTTSLTFDLTSDKEQLPKKNRKNPFSGKKK